MDVVASVPEQPDAVPTERLMTMTACHPMFSARQRYVVYAVLETWQPGRAAADLAPRAAWRRPDVRVDLAAPAGTAFRSGC